VLLVLPSTSPIRHTSHFVPLSYDYHPSQGYHPYYDAPRFAFPPYPSPELDSFHQPSAEELEERRYQSALEVVANRRRRQAEKEAAIRRKQLAEAARQRYFTTLTAEFEQRRQEEMLATLAVLNSSVFSKPERVELTSTLSQWEQEREGTR